MHAAEIATKSFDVMPILMARPHGRHFSCLPPCVSLSACFGQRSSAARMPVAIDMPPRRYFDATRAATDDRSAISTQSP
jgi:hypothetical protein